MKRQMSVKQFLLLRQVSISALSPVCCRERKGLATSLPAAIRGRVPVGSVHSLLTAALVTVHTS